MRSNDLITPEGTKDLLFEECIIRQLIEDKIHKIFNQHGILRADNSKHRIL